MKLFLLSFFLIVFIIGCSTTSNTTLVNENYTVKQNTPKELIIFPFLYDSLKILNWDDVVEDVMDEFKVDSANCKTFIYDTLSKSLIVNSKSCTRLLTIIDGRKLFDWNTMIKDKNNYQRIEKKIDKKYKAKFLIPKKELLTEEHTNSYALIINSIVIGRNLSGLGGITNWYRSGSPGNLGARTSFIIWDYEKNDFVKCGIIISQEDLSVFGGLTKGTWLYLFKTIPLELYEDTPFGISPVNYYYNY
jgi:hypothetical protein